MSGNRLAMVDGDGAGGFDLNGAADNVKVEILSAAGQVIDSLNLGAKSSGRHGFEWPAGKVQDGDGYRFRVTANSGTASVLGGTLMRDTVESRQQRRQQPEPQLRHSGEVPYETVKAFN